MGAQQFPSNPQAAREPLLSGLGTETRHRINGHGQNLGLVAGESLLNPSKLFPLRSRAVAKDTFRFGRLKRSESWGGTDVGGVRGCILGSRFNEPLETAFRTNVDGTAHLIALCRGACLSQAVSISSILSIPSIPSIPVIPSIPSIRIWSPWLAGVSQQGHPACQVPVVSCHAP